MCVGGRGCACGYAPRVSGCVWVCTKTNSGPEMDIAHFHLVPPTPALVEGRQKPVRGLMADDRHTSMASHTPHVALTCDLHPTPYHSHPTSLHTKLPYLLPCTPRRVHQSGRTILFTIANASHLTTRTTPHPVCPHGPDLFCLCLFAPPFFVLVHSLVVVYWRAWFI